MKKILLAAVLLLSPLYAMANEACCNPPSIPGASKAPGSQSGAAVGVTTDSTSGAINSGVSQGITFNTKNPGHTDTTVHQAPNMSSSFLTTSNNTCQGSAGGGFTIVDLGINGATTYTVLPCEVEKEATSTVAQGQAAAALGMQLASAGHAVVGLPLIIKGTQSIEDGIDTMCAFENVYLVRQVRNRKCPIRPIHNDIRDAAPGGMIRLVAEPNPGYIDRPVLQAQPKPMIDQAALDRAIKEENAKRDLNFKKHVMK